MQAGKMEISFFTQRMVGSYQSIGPWESEEEHSGILLGPEPKEYNNFVCDSMPANVKLVYLGSRRHKMHPMISTA
jgi:hypothetical protein